MFKEKDYDFTNKQRLVKLVQTSDNPLKADRPRAQVQRGRTKGLPIKNSVMDPLSRQAKTIDPLKRDAKVDPLSRDPLQRQQSAKPPQIEQLQQIKIEAPKEQFDTFKKDGDTQIKISWELSSYWLEIRQDYFDQYEIKNMNLESAAITNPFGSQVSSLNTFDGQARAAHTGESRIELDKSQVKIAPGKQISLKTYVQKVEDMRRDLRKNWLNQDKVVALQLAIHACKLLIDNERPNFAPIKFIYVIDILETFGRFVIERLLKLSYPGYSDQRIQETSLQSVIGSNISETAQEIGRNWLIKIGSIRELLPRLYIEATLLKVYYFIDPSRIRFIFNRLIKSVRALGDYINAIQFALYLFRLAAEIFSGDKDFIIWTLKDFFIYMKQRKTFCKPGMSDEEYLVLFLPFLKQAFRLYSQNCSEREFRELFEHFRQSNQHHMVLRKMLEIFPAINVCSMAVELFSIMQAYQVEIKYQLYAVFLPKIAKGLTNKAAGQEICELVLADCMHIKSFPLFLDILASLIELIFRSFKGYQKSQFFFKILQKFNDLFLLVEKDNISNNTNKAVFVKLHQFILSIFQNAENLQEVLQIETFIQCVQIFPPDMKPQVCKDLLKIIIDRDPSEMIEDPMAVHSILSLAKTLNEKKLQHNKVEQQYLGTLINGFMKRVDFNRDLEQTLNLYADVRGNFCNISDISENLINKTINLIFKAKKFGKGKQTKKINQFVQACIAYCYITIPTIDSIIAKLRLYIQVAQIGLGFSLLQQTEALFKTAIELIAEAPETIDGKPSDEMLLPFIVDNLSFLIIMPDDPEVEYLSLFSGVYAVICKFKWNPKNGGILQIPALISCMQYLCCQVQDRLPYHMEGVKSNDALFNKENDFKMKIVETVQQVYVQIEEIVDRIMKASINDSLENASIIRISFSAIQRILNMVKITSKNSGTIEKIMQLIQRKTQELNKDRIGKAQIQILKAHIISSIILIESQVPSCSTALRDLEKIVLV